MNVVVAIVRSFRKTMKDYGRKIVSPFLIIRMDSAIILGITRTKKVKWVCLRMVLQKMNCLVNLIPLFFTHRNLIQKWIVKVWWHLNSFNALWFVDFLLIWIRACSHFYSCIWIWLFVLFYLIFSCFYFFKIHPYYYVMRKI